jgi:hypothetical protein
VKDPLVVTKVNRAALICRDQKLIAENARSIRKLCREFYDDGSDRAMKRSPKKKR